MFKDEVLKERVLESGLVSFIILVIGYSIHLIARVLDFHSISYSVTKLFLLSIAFFFVRIFSLKASPKAFDKRYWSVIAGIFCFILFGYTGFFSGLSRLIVWVFIIPMAILLTWFVFIVRQFLFDLWKEDGGENLE